MKVFTKNVLSLMALLAFALSANAAGTATYTDQAGNKTTVTGSQVNPKKSMENMKQQQQTMPKAKSAPTSERFHKELNKQAPASEGTIEGTSTAPATHTGY